MSSHHPGHNPLNIQVPFQWLLLWEWQTTKYSRVHFCACSPCRMHHGLVQCSVLLAHLSRFWRKVFATDSAQHNNENRIHEPVRNNISQKFKHVFICPIAIVHETNYKFSLSLSQHVSVCLSVSMLKVTFLDRFSPKVAQRQQPPKARMSLLWVNTAPPLPYFAPKNCHFWAKRSWKAMQT